MSRLPPLPTLPRPPQRTPFPLIAVIAPVVGAVAIGAIMRSPFVLVFAILSPLIAIATMVDGRRQARVHRRAEAARFERECQAFDAAIDVAHRAESTRARAEALASRMTTGDKATVLIGTAAAPSSVMGDMAMPLDDDASAERLRALIARAATNPALPALVPRSPVTIIGRGLAADALEQRLRRQFGIAVHRFSAQSPPVDADGRHGTVIDVRTATRVLVRDGDHIADVRAEYGAGADIFADELDGIVEPDNAHTVPDVVSWSSIEHERAGFSVPVGHDASGVVSIDLVSHGPHAIIGGTTGSGKSELLRSLALGWASWSSPMRAQMLFVDFKGGATFAGLTTLPHCAGIVTDLDGVGATRVMQSLRTEVRRRERLLAEHGARDVRERPELMPRLLVLIDEYAAMLEAHPELATLMADLAARGRSLGLHLVLCTQAPGTAVRDAVAANCPVRVSFRVTDPASAAFLGRSAPDLLGVRPGRALAVGLRRAGDGKTNSHVGESATEVRSLQVAVAADSDIDVVRRRWKDAERPPAPWLPPLPIDIDRPMVLAADHDRIIVEQGVALQFGLVDRPDEQRRTRAEWSPLRDGTLGVIGAARSGKSTTLAVLARSGRDHGLEPVVLAGEPHDAWASLERLREPSGAVLLLADDLDLLFARARDLAGDLIDLWDDAVMGVLDQGGAVAASLTPSSATRGPLAARLSSRLVLRTTDADEHAVLGLPRGAFDHDAPPGRGWWAGRLTQVIHEHESLGSAERLEPPQWRLESSTDVAFVCRRPERVAALLVADHPELDVVCDLASALAPRSSDEVVIHPRALVGTPAAWNSAFASLQSWRARTDIVLVDVAPGDARALLGTRVPPPPLARARGEVWVARPGEGPRRHRWAALAGSENPGSG